MSPVQVRSRRDPGGQLHVELTVHDLADCSSTTSLAFRSHASVGFDRDGRIAAINLFEVPETLARIAPALDRATPAICPHDHAWIDWWLDDGWAWFPLTLEQKVMTLVGPGRTAVEIQGERVVGLSLDLSQSWEAAR